MALGDIMGSIAVSFSTLPMPSDVIYPFAGPSIGSIGTCTAQGLFHSIGLAWSVSMTLLLSVYFLMRVRYRMTEATFTRKIFPIACLLIFILALVVIGIFATTLKMINPSPYRSYCTIADYPYGCADDEEVDCLRGDAKSPNNQAFFDAMVIIVLISLPLWMLTMVTSLGLIILTYYQKSRSLRQARLEERSIVDLAIADLAIEQDSGIVSNNGEETVAQRRFRRLERLQQQENHFKNFISVYTFHSLLFLGAFLIPWLPVLLHYIGDLGEVPWLQCMKLIFQPLHGFCHMLVFVYVKISHIRTLHPESSYTECFRILWHATETLPETLKSRVSRYSLEPEDEHDGNTEILSEDTITPFSKNKIPETGEDVQEEKSEITSYDYFQNAPQNTTTANDDEDPQIDPSNTSEESKHDPKVTFHIGI